MTTILKTLTPNKAVNLFFNDELTHAEKVRAFGEKNISADSLFYGLCRETECNLSTGYDIQLEYTRVFFPNYRPSEKLIKAIFSINN